jgi:hypothetical protein
MSDTTYIVLRRDNEGLLWRVVDSHLDAASTDAALRKAVHENGVYVAVPERSFKPVTVTTETKTVLKLEQPAEPA